MHITGMGAGHIGVQALDFMGKSGGHEEIEGAVGDGRLRAVSGFAQGRQQIIGPKRAVLTQQNFKRLAADGGEIKPVLAALRLGLRQRRLDALGMVVWFKADGEPVTIYDGGDYRRIAVGNWREGEASLSILVRVSDLPRWREAIDRAIKEGEANGR